MEKRVLVVLADGFEETEALAPVDILRRAGALVTIAGVGSSVIRSSHNVFINCDTLIDNTDLFYDAIVLPGGMPGAANLAANKEVSKRILNINKNGGFVTAICASPAVVLAPLGVLNGKKAVCYPKMEHSFAEIDFGTERVCRDGNIITSRGPGCAFEFGFEIAEALFGREKSDELKKSMIC